MWNAPLTNGTTLSVATGSALFLFGLSIGIVIAGACWVFIAERGDGQASSRQEGYATISDDEIEIVVEIVREAVAADSGWTLCGDCYCRRLLQQLPFPTVQMGDGKLEESELASPHIPTSFRARDPISTRRVDSGEHFIQNVPVFREKPLRSQPAGRAWGT